MTLRVLLAIFAFTACLHFDTSRTAAYDLGDFDWCFNTMPKVYDRAFEACVDANCTRISNKHAYQQQEGVPEAGLLSDLQGGGRGNLPDPAGPGAGTQDRHAARTVNVRSGSPRRPQFSRARKCRSAAAGSGGGRT